MQTAWHGELAATSLDKTAFSVDDRTVAVIVPTFNHARFLPDAIMSVLAQTRPADAIIVVDDGSTDNTATVVAQFPMVQLIRQENRGLAAARNTGIQSCKTSHIVFLDADDRLLPIALEAGLTCIAGHPDCAFVYGGCHYVSEDGRPFGSHIAKPIDGDAFLAFLSRNRVGGIMTVLFRRDCLLAVNGFDQTLPQGEDYDLYLRMTQKYSIASHPEIVGEYRRHGQNMSNDHVVQLKAALLILDRHEARIVPDDLMRDVLREARTQRRNHYVSRMLQEASMRWRANHEVGILMRDLVEAARWAPFFTVRSLVGTLIRRASKMFPYSAAGRDIK